MKTRKTAMKLALEVHGTLWFLFELKKLRIVEKVDALEIARDLPLHGFYASEHELQDVLRLVERDC